MTINIQSVHFDADKKLIDFINDKVKKLNTYYEGIITSEVTLKLDKNSNNENKIAEIKMNSKGHEFFAKKQCASFEEATDLSCDALKSQLKKHKEKIQSH
ncbi:MAG: ribosome-associated translation inhibitor RaiA [Bacteroidetes bacterium]|jgi:putative sigma-54 modulation protein|nr:ribosome-associated translation inhibitor RaiA [Bacteroidota bacterium]